MTERVEWIDTARGIAIVLVALYHSALFLEPLASDGGWLSFMRVLDTFRMPLFFFAAGVFSAKILGQTFSQLWNRRLLLFVYLYVLWSTIRFVCFQFIPWSVDDVSPSDWRQFVLFPVLPGGGLWFVYALALFSLFVWVFRKAWWGIPVGISLVVSVVFGSGMVSVGSEAWTKTGMYMFFFVASVYLRDFSLRWAAAIKLWMVVPIVVVYGAAGTAFWVVESLRDIPGLRVVVSILGVAAGVAMSVGLVRIGWSALARYLGRRTLPIYLFHYLPIAVFAGVMMATGLRFDRFGGLIAVPVVAAGAIALSLLLMYLLRNVHGVFDLPRFLTRGKPVSAKEQ